jgi:hypothetical protein
MRRRFTVRGLMALTAGAALLVGGPREFLRLRALKEEYAGRAIQARRAMAKAEWSQKWTHDRWPAECRRIEETEQKWMGGRFKMARPMAPDRAGRLVAYWKPILAKYERAARYPWLPVEPDPPRPE